MTQASKAIQRNPSIGALCKEARHGDCPAAGYCTCTCHRCAICGGITDCSPLCNGYEPAEQVTR